jgi:hypothetical protein
VGGGGGGGGGVETASARPPVRPSICDLESAIKPLDRFPRNSVQQLFTQIAQQP